MWYICLHLYRILVYVVNIINKLANDYVFGIVRDYSTSSDYLQDAYLGKLTPLSLLQQRCQFTHAQAARA